MDPKHVHFVSLSSLDGTKQSVIDFINMFVDDGHTHWRMFPGGMNLVLHKVSDKVLVYKGDVFLLTPYLKNEINLRSRRNSSRSEKAMALGE